MTVVPHTHKFGINAYYDQAGRPAPKPTRPNRVDAQVAAQLRDTGWKWTEIAAHFGVSHQAAHNAVRRHKERA